MTIDILDGIPRRVVLVSGSPGARMTTNLLGGRYMRHRRTALFALIPLAGAGVFIATTSVGAQAATGPTISVNTTAGRHPISRDIYGMNFADEALAKELNLPVRRWGGNATTRYNYALDETNRGSDWFFE